MAELNEKQKRLLTERRIASVATVGADGAPHLTRRERRYAARLFSISVAEFEVVDIFTRRLGRTPPGGLHLVI